MKIMRSEDIMTKAISEIIEPDWDVRSTPEDEVGILALSNSLKKDGFLNPITCIRFGKKFKVIAGRRRLKAAKLAGLKQVPIYVKDDLGAELDYKRAAMIENCCRKDMIDSERGKAFFMVYQQAGYTKEQVIGGVKSIDNWFSHHTNNKTDWEKHKSFMLSEEEKRTDQNPLSYDPQFVEICKDIPFTPKYQYQLMQLIVQLKPEVLKKAEEADLSTEQKILLTTRPLRDHPQIQKELIQEIKNDLPKKRIQQRVKQVAKDLETGYLSKSDGGTYVYDTTADREMVKGGDKVLEPIQVAHLDITAAINEFLFRITNRSLTKGEFEYSEKIIQNTKDYRLEVVKVGSDRGLIAMEKDLQLVADVSLETLKLIEREFETRKAKEGMISK